MQRRDLLVTLGIAATAPQLAWSATPPYVGFLSGGDVEGAEDFVNAMLDGLRAEGYSQPQALRLDRVYADYAMDKVPLQIGRAHV